MTRDLDKRLAEIVADVGATISTRHIDGDAPLAVQMLILAELRAMRAELEKLNAAGGTLMANGF